MAPVLAYWNFRGYAETIRYLLHYIGEPFEDKRYEFGEDFTKNEWSQEKYNLGLEFPNLPYYIDGDLKLTQSVAILRYLGRKHGLIPTTDEELIRADTLEHIAKDIQQNIVSEALDLQFLGPDMKEIWQKKCLEPLKLVSESLDGKKWLLGDKLTYVDFLMYEAVCQYSYLVTDLLVQFAPLAHYLHRIESLPGIHKYRTEGSFKEWPIFGPISSWGGTGDMPKRKGVL